MPALKLTKIIFKNGLILTKFKLNNNIHTTNYLKRLIDFKLSDIGEGIKEVVIKEWYVKLGDQVKQFDNICEVQSDKASVTITSRYDGKIANMPHNIDDIVQVGNTLLTLDIEQEETKQEETRNISINLEESNKEQQNISNQIESIRRNEKPLATPNVRHFAKEKQVNLNDVNGTGPNGRILKDDILRFLNIEHSTEMKSDEKEIKITGYMKGMFNTMTESLKIPHFVYSDEVQMDRLIQMRKELLNDLKSIKNGESLSTELEVVKLADIKLTFMPFFIKAISQCLLEYPILNSRIVDDSRVVLIKSHNICVAINTPYGLVVPNIKDCQNKNIFQIAKELTDLIDLGSKRLLQKHHLSDGTFSLSNIGVIGGTYTKPVILPPQVAIGAVGRIMEVPRYDKDSNLVKTSVINVSWAADHRVIDGVTMANFSEHWNYLLNHPNLLLIV